MKLAVMTDEVSSDFGSALEILSTWDVDAVEIRRVGERRYPDVGEYWLDRVPRLLQEFRLPVVAISPGLFKIRYPGEAGPPHFHRDADEVQVGRETAIAAALERHVNVLLPRSIQAAEQLRAPIIIVWSFERQDHGPAPDGAVQVLRHAASKAASAGITLALEVQDLSSRVAELVQRVDHPAFGVSWTPASAYAAGEAVPYPDGYNTLKPYIRHVHFKDVRAHPRGQTRVPDNVIESQTGHPWVLDGVINWKDQITQLHRDGYAGFVSVEPHVRPQIAAAKHTLDRVRRLMAAA
jgi:sugar phosphate isomerase/epimerase